MPRRTLLAPAAALVLLLAQPSASAYAPPGRTERISQIDGGQAMNAGVSAMTPDGTKVLLYGADPLMPSDTNGAFDVYLKDLVTGSLERVSLTHDGGEPNGNCTNADLTDDARLVVFECNATNMIPADANGNQYDVYIRDRMANTTTLVSRSTSGVQNVTTAYWPEISGDGGAVTFQSFADNLVPNDANLYWDIFVRDLERETTELVSVTSDERQGVFNPNYPVITRDGRYIAFEAHYPYDPRDTNGMADIYVRDRVAGTTTLASLTSDGRAAEGSSINASISDDGRFVAFSSNASSFVENDRWVAQYDAFVHDRQTGVTERVNVSPAGVEGAGGAGTVTLSADGRYVVANVIAGLVEGDGNGTTDVYLFDRADRSAELISAMPDGTADAAGSATARVSADGSVVAFWSAADLLGDGLGGGSAYVRRRGPHLGTGWMDATPQGGGVQVEGWARFSGRPVSSARDAANDSQPGTPVGAELVGASVIYRPELGDVLFEVERSARRHVSAPAVRTQQPPPNAVTFGWELTAGGARFEVRAVSGPTGHAFVLLRCATSCEKVADLSGGIGTAGERVTVSVPLSDLAVSQGGRLELVRAYAAAGEATTGPLVTADEVPLAAGGIPAASVSVGVAPAGSHADDVELRPALLLDGRFSAHVPAVGKAARAWARVCLGSECRVTSTGVSE